jgi:hypothetical protein
MHFSRVFARGELVANQLGFNTRGVDCHPGRENYFVRDNASAFSTRRPCHDDGGQMRVAHPLDNFIFSRPSSCTNKGFLLTQHKCVLLLAHDLIEMSVRYLK